MDNSLRDSIAAVLSKVAEGRALYQVSNADTAVMAEAIIEELGLRYEYENGRVMYHPKPAACKPNGNWKYRVCSDLRVYLE